MPYQIARACPIDRDEMYAIFFERNFRPETYNAYSGKDVDKYANLVAAYTSDQSLGDIDEISDVCLNLWNRW